jgi:hypothetical protein
MIVPDKSRAGAGVSQTRANPDIIVDGGADSFQGDRMAAHADTLGAIALEDIVVTFQKIKAQTEGALAQVDDADFFRTIDAESNSIAVIVKHVGGNLRSRWTDFLSTDGEKPTRDRDGEFVVAGETTRADVMATWSAGWATLFSTLAALSPSDLTTTVSIRAESMPAIAAMNRAVAHISSHAGQIVLLAKHYRSSDWKTLSIPRGRSNDWHTNAPGTR